MKQLPPLERRARTRAGGGLVPLLVLIVLVLAGVIVGLTMMEGERADGTDEEHVAFDDAPEVDERAVRAAEGDALAHALESASERTPEGKRPDPRDEWPTPEVEAAPGKDPVDPPALLVEMDADMQALSAMRRGDDPTARLAVAREILARSDAKPILVIAALNTLAELDPRTALEEIEARLDRNEARMLGRAIDILARTPNGASDAEIAAFYEKGDDDVQLAVARALQDRGDESYLLRYEERWASELSNEDWQVRTQAIQQLTMARLEPKADAFLPLLDDPSDEVRLAALSAIGQTKPNTAILERVRQMTNDESEHVKRIATRVLERMERVLENESRR